MPVLLSPTGAQGGYGGYLQVHINAGPHVAGSG